MIVTDTTKHVYVEKIMLFTYQKADDEYLYMKSSLTLKLLSFTKVTWKITFKKQFTFNNILHVADIKNLVFDLLLSKNMFKMVCECNKFIIIKNRISIK